MILPWCGVDRDDGHFRISGRGVFPGNGIPREGEEEVNPVLVVNATNDLIRQPLHNFLGRRLVGPALMPLFMFHSSFPSR